MTEPAVWWLAIALTGLVALTAWRVGSLRADGAVAALLIGVLALRVSWAWGAFLVGWFMLASLLSRFGRVRKAARTHHIVMKDGRRDAIQVLANGGVFAACALFVGASRTVAHPELAMVLTAAAAGALTAAGADTWATEIGTLWGGQPWSLRTGRRMPVGTSGAVTLTGSLGGVFGALTLAAFATAVGMIPLSITVAVALGGIAGAAADTLLGAWGQERRWCPRCAEATERIVHVCGTATEHRGGVRRLDNDVVNALCSLVGAIISATLAMRGMGSA